MEKIMGKLGDFLTYFGAYVILFLVFILVILVGAMIGITLRKRKNRQAETLVAQNISTQDTVQQDTTEQ